MKKIIIISQDTSIPLGELSESGMYHLHLATHYDSYTIVILSTRKDHLKNRYQHGNVEIYCTNVLFKPYSLLAALQLLKELHEHSHFDLLLAENPQYAGIVAAIAKRLWNIPICVQLPGTYHYLPGWEEEGWSNSAWKYAISTVLKRADRMRVYNHPLTKILKETYPTKSAHISHVPPVIDLQEFSRKLKKKTHVSRLLLVCDLIESKNISMVLEVFAKLIKLKPELTLTIVGEGSLKNDIKQHIRVLSLQKSVTLIHKTLDNEQLREYFDTADIFVSTSSYEGWCPYISKAMAAGLPVVATSIGCFADDYLGKDLAKIVDANNPVQLQEALLWCLLNPDKATEMGQKGREAVLEKLEPSKLFTNLLQLLDLT